MHSFESSFRLTRPILRKISNYYSGSTQQSVLSQIYYVFKNSAALTIAHRNSKKYAVWALRRYGKDIAVKIRCRTGRDTVVKLLIPRSEKIR
jgi:hypothetical protein